MRRKFRVYDPEILRKLSEVFSPIEFQIILSRTMEKYHKAVRILLQHFKCKRCGWCCSTMPAQLDDIDIINLANFLKISKNKFLKKYCVSVPSEGVKLRVPCPFLQNNTCKIYHVRPKVCKFYPFSYFPQVLHAVDKCPLSNEINNYLKKILEEIERKRNWKEIFYYYNSFDPLDKAIYELINKFLKKTNLQSKTLKEIIRRKPKEEKEDNVKCTYYHLVLLEYAADKLKREKRRRESK